MTFNGEKLPRPTWGMYWGVLIYPGGRTELKQYIPEMLLSVNTAVDRLLAGREVRVKVQDAAIVVALWKEEKPDEH